MKTSLNKKTIEKFISSNPIFYSLKDEIISEIASQIEIEKFAPEESIVTEGEHGDSFYIIFSGHVKVIRTDLGGEELVMAKLDPGEGFGEMALLLDQPRSATVKAVDSVETLKIKRKNFKKLLEKYPELQLQISKLIKWRVSLLEETTDTLSKEKFKVREKIFIDLPLLELLFKFNLAAGGPEQVEFAKKTAILAEEMSKILCPVVSDLIICAAYLYEIGKVSLSQTLLEKERKDEKLTPEEFEKFSKIWSITLDVLKPFKIIQENISFIKYLNENNYKKMPLETQILKVAADFQKMINPYYLNLPVKKAMNKIKLKSGTLYNPKVIMALEKTLDKFNKLQTEDQINFLKSMNIALDHKDHYTLAHSLHTRQMALKIAKKLYLSKKEKDMLSLGCDLHDVGKIYIKEEILNAPRKLTPEEFEIMKKHPIWSAHLFSEIPGTEELVSVILHHHEKYDGTGYPDRLKGENIPLLSRIMCIGDVFSALTTKRVYRINKKGQSYAFAAREALQTMEKMQPGHFDSELFKIFKEIIREETSEKTPDTRL